MIVPESQIEDIIICLHRGEVIAYPTEAVFGLGCDPDNEQAVLKLLTIKSRAIEKGLILIASDFSQLIPYIALEQLTELQKKQLLTSWPGAITWLLPKSVMTPYWLTGKYPSIAVRISAHPLVQKLCHHYGKPIVSTSANPSGMSPAISAAQVEQMFNRQIMILDGKVSGRSKPSEIRDIITNKVIRQG